MFKGLFCKITFDNLPPWHLCTYWRAETAFNQHNIFYERVSIVIQLLVNSSWLRLFVQKILPNNIYQRSNIKIARTKEFLLSYHIIHWQMYSLNGHPVNTDRVRITVNGLDADLFINIIIIILFLASLSDKTTFLASITPCTMLGVGSR